MKLHNTLTHTIDHFSPLTSQTVSLYTCGPTVYDYLHIGNWTAYIYWDLLIRTLEESGYTPNRVMNITDVGHLVSDSDEGQDKLEKGARREGKTAWQVADFYTKDFLAGMEQLNLRPPNHITKATDYITEQLDLIRTLKQKGYTYQIDDGIYFDTALFPDYAAFAGLDLAAQRAGARVDFNSAKKNPSDFALWKFSPRHETRDMQWPTPSDICDDTDQEPRMGFPGWHLECSAMALTLLGNTIDIHTGGIDHIPVHHTNEIAQSEAATEQRFANYWLHSNHLKVDGTKISKSLQNGYTLHDLATKDFSPLDFRLFTLQSHYRSESNFTFENLDAAAKRRRNWRSVAALRHQLDDVAPLVSQADIAAVNDHVTTSLQNDLRSSDALAAVDELFKKLAGQRLAQQSYASFHQLLELLDRTLGLELLVTTPPITEAVTQLITQRDEARQVKDWAQADRLRDQLHTAGYQVLDTPGGAVWYYS